MATNDNKTKRVSDRTRYMPRTLVQTHTHTHSHIEPTDTGWNLVSGILMAAYVSGPKWIDLTHSTHAHIHTHSHTHPHILWHTVIHNPLPHTLYTQHSDELLQTFPKANAKKKVVCLHFLLPSLPLLLCRPPTSTLSLSHSYFVSLPFSLSLSPFLKDATTFLSKKKAISLNSVNSESAKCAD